MSKHNFKNPSEIGDVDGLVTHVGKLLLISEFWSQRNKFNTPPPRIKGQTTKNVACPILL